MFFVKSSNVYLKVKLMTLVNLKSDRSRNNQVRSDRVRSYRVRNDRAINDQVRSYRVRFDRARSDRVRNDRVRNNQVRNDRVRNDSKPHMHTSYNFEIVSAAGICICFPLLTSQSYPPLESASASRC